MVNIEDYRLDGDVILSSGKESNVYYELRSIATDNRDLLEICEIIHMMIQYGNEKFWKYKVLIGREFGGALISTALLVKHPITYRHLILRREKSYGNPSRLLYSPRYNWDVIINMCKEYGTIFIEDLCTTGKTCEKSLRYLFNMNIPVDRIIVLYNRGKIKSIMGIELEVVIKK